MRLACLAAAALVAGCGAPEQPLALDGDYVLVDDAPGRQTLDNAPRALGANVLYLNFTGATVVNGAPDSASKNVSQILPAQRSPAVFPPFDPSIPAPKVSAQEAEDAVFDRIRTLFRPYNIQVVRARPAEPDYTMIIVGGDPTLAGRTANVAGVAPLDCTNANKSNVVFDFSDNLPPEYGGVVAIALTAAHEAGHSLGLEHTDNPADVMFSVNPNMATQSIADLFTAAFTTDGKYSGYNGSGGVPRCSGRGDATNADAHLKMHLGPRTAGDLTKPQLAWDFPPPPVQDVPATIPLAFTASDETELERLEVYKNLELIAVLKTPPFHFTVEAAAPEQFYLTVEAVDTSANRTTITRLFNAESRFPPLCPDPGACAEGRACEDGYCKLPIGEPCQASVACQGTLDCRKVQDAEVCTQPCTDEAPCPSGLRCVDGYCGPAGRSPVGEACRDGSECESGRCHETCLVACDEATPCQLGACEEVSGGRACVPPPASGCATAPGVPAPMPLGLALFAIAVAVRGTRRAWGRGAAAPTAGSNPSTPSA